MLIYNDIPVVEGEIYPFGKNPNIFDTFYIACKDAFSKKICNITITFGGAAAPDIEPNNLPVRKVQGIGQYFARQLELSGIKTLGQLLCVDEKRLTEILYVARKFVRTTTYRKGTSWF
jgi:hypothetical protein